MKENIRIAGELGKIQSELNSGEKINTIIERYIELKEKADTETEQKIYEVVVQILTDQRQTMIENLQEKE
ncbi:MAG: hypothetical protein IJE49_00800 [Agathobacter sp.]|nr:hypothetical protein [Agathobacter sp.]